MTTVLGVVPTVYRSASRQLGDDVSVLVRLGADQLVGALENCGGMAGSDDCGQAWGASYDDAVRSAFGAMTDVHNGCQVIGELLDQTAANYAGAEALSSGLPGAGREFFADLSCHFAGSPSASGSSGVGTPPGWALVEGFVHRTWPNGHQDRLHAAGDAWQRFGTELLSLTSDVDRTSVALTALRAPEVYDAAAVVDDLRAHVFTLADECWAIGAQCHGYAHELDEAHHRVIDALEDLLHRTVETAVVGTLFAIVTAGAGAMVAAAAETAAVRAAAGAVAAIIDVLVASAVSVAAEMDLAATRVAEISDAVRPLLARKVEQAELVQSRIRGDALLAGRALPAADSPAYAADSTTIPARALGRLQAFQQRVRAAAGAPRIHLSPLQLQKKFKHAKVLGVLGNYSKGTAVEFSDAVQDFVAGANTTTVQGTYRGAVRYLSYDPANGIVIVSKLDGEFVSCWRMTAAQAKNVYDTGDLGGG